MPKYTKRADGRYLQTIVVGRKSDGKPIRKYIYADTVKELRSKVAKARIELHTGDLVGEDTLFSTVAQTWLHDYKYMTSEKVRMRYEHVVDAHLKPLANRKLRDLLPLHLQGIINTMAQSGYSKHTMREIKQTAVQIMNMAVDNNLINKNVFMRVTVPDIEPKQRLPISTQAQSLIEETWRNHRMGMPALIMLYCGLRKGELLALKWSDVHIEEKYIDVSKSLTYLSNQPNVKTPKTKDGKRKVPIPNILITVLTETRGEDDSPVCPSVNGETMSGVAFRRAWESYQHFLNLQAGGRDATRSKEKVVALEPFTAHQLRHTYATILYDAGVDALTTQRYMGHADVETTLRIYTHLTKEKQELSLNSLNDALNRTI